MTWLPGSVVELDYKGSVDERSCPKKLERRFSSPSMEGEDGFALTKETLIYKKTCFSTGRMKQFVT